MSCTTREESDSKISRQIPSDQASYKPVITAHNSALTDEWNVSLVNNKWNVLFAWSQHRLGPHFCFFLFQQRELRSLRFFGGWFGAQPRAFCAVSWVFPLSLSGWADFFWVWHCSSRNTTIAHPSAFRPTARYLYVVLLRLFVQIC